MRYFASSLNSILTPVIATAVLGMAGMGAVIGIDLFTFGIAFLTLAFGITIPEKQPEAEREGLDIQSAAGEERKESLIAAGEEGQESLIAAAKQGIVYLKQERGIFDLILFLAAINLVASIYDAAFPAMMLSRNGGSQKVLGALRISCWLWGERLWYGASADFWLIRSLNLSWLPRAAGVFW